MDAFLARKLAGIGVFADKQLTAGLMNANRAMNKRKPPFLTRNDMSMNLIEILAEYRIVVGYLGEKEQFGWWQSSFFTRGSQAFLSPLFGRTQTLAQCNGVTRAAALVHDERIGVGHVYHLFRLPEEIEQGIHRILHEPSLVQQLQKMIESPESALNVLRKSTANKQLNGEGPILVGKIQSMRDTITWHTVARAYLSAFEQKSLVFPYFTDL